MQVLLVCAVVLAACGGGGGDGDAKKKNKKSSVDDMAELADDMCACKDGKCGKRIRSDARELERELGDDLDAADRKVLRRHRKKLDRCYEDLDDECAQLKAEVCDGDKDCEKDFDRESTGDKMSPDDKRSMCKVVLEDRSVLAELKKEMTRKKSKKKSTDGMADAYKAYVDDYCACVDKKDKAGECAKAATEKFNKDNAPRANDKPDPAEIAAFVKETEAATKKFSECTEKIVQAATAAAAGW